MQKKEKIGLCITRDDLFFLSMRMKELEMKHPEWSAYGVLEEALAELEPEKVKKREVCYILEE